jgi:hypothetical protein
LKPVIESPSPIFSLSFDDKGGQDGLIQRPAQIYCLKNDSLPIGIVVVRTLCTVFPIRFNKVTRMNNDSQISVFVGHHGHFPSGSSRNDNENTM